MKGIAEGFKDERAINIPHAVRRLQLQNPITNQLYLTHIGHYPRAENHFRDRPCGSEDCIFFFCHGGRGLIRLGKSMHELGPRQVFILPAKRAHTYQADEAEPWTISWFHFSGKNLGMFASIMGRLIDVEETRNGRCVSIFEEMYERMESGYSMEHLEYVSNCLMYLMTSLRYSYQARGRHERRLDDPVQRSIQFMKENIEDAAVSLADIARHAGYSSSHFGALFAKRTSYAPMEYLNQLKIQRACSLLRFSDLKVKEIAFRLGFYDPFHFSKVFRKEMKMSPREYRQKNEE